MRDYRLFGSGLVCLGVAAFLQTLERIGAWHAWSLFAAAAKPAE